MIRLTFWEDSEGVVHLQEALDAVDDMLIGGMFGAAGARVVIEEFMSGEEASFFAVIDGDSAVPLVSAQVCACGQADGRACSEQSANSLRSYQSLPSG